jgi:hypothetical protein
VVGEVVLLLMSRMKVGVEEEVVVLIPLNRMMVGMKVEVLLILSYIPNVAVLSSAAFVLGTQILFLAPGVAYVAGSCIDLWCPTGECAVTTDGLGAEVAYLDLCVGKF